MDSREKAAGLRRTSLKEYFPHGVGRGLVSRTFFIALSVVYWAIKPFVILEARRDTC